MKSLLETALRAAAGAAVTTFGEEFGRAADLRLSDEAARLLLKRDLTKKERRQLAAALRRLADELEEER